MRDNNRVMQEQHIGIYVRTADGSIEHVALHKQVSDCWPRLVLGTNRMYTEKYTERISYLALRTGVISGEPCSK